MTLKMNRPVVSRYLNTKSDTGWRLHTSISIPFDPALRILIVRVELRSLCALDSAGVTKCTILYLFAAHLVFPCHIPDAIERRLCVRTVVLLHRAHLFAVGGGDLRHRRLFKQPPSLPHKVLACTENGANMRNRHTSTTSISRVLQQCSPLD